MKFKHKTKIFITIFFVSFASSISFATRPIISHISAMLGQHGTITVSWQLPFESNMPIVSLLLYRDTQPITTRKTLERLRPIASLPATATSYLDTLPDFLSYYYAVLTVTSGGTYDILLPSVNSTVTPAQRKAQIQPPQYAAESRHFEKNYPNGTMRETPLPSISNAESTKRYISETTKTKAASLVSDTANQTKDAIAPYIFEEDYFSPKSGDAYILFETLRRTFVQKNYTSAIEQLEILTGTNLEKDIVLRGTFYLGQSYYFSGEHMNAVRCFLMTSEKYPELSKKWIDYALNLINN